MRHLLVLTVLLAACAPARSTPGGGGQPPSSDLPELASGWYFGECWGECQGRLELAADGSFTFESFGWEGEVYLSVQGSLTDDTEADIAEAWAALDRGSLEAVYGCPDCADGGGEFVELAGGVGPERVDWEFGNPPDELKDLVSWLDVVEQAARQCEEGTGIITVDVCDGGDVDGDNDPDPSPPPPG